MTNEIQQTAVDWQFDQLSNENLLGIFTHDQMTRVMEILEQSNKKFKEQIQNAYRDGKISVIAVTKIPSEQYYEQKYTDNK
jgi:hypothetical protein